MILYEPLLNLIKNNKNWKQFLEDEPRSITIKQCTWRKEDGSLECPELYMFSYDGIFSDFNDEYVRLCRGCIISLEDPKNPYMICAPFYKFGNMGQSFCPEIDWGSALVEQKVDGILIKLFYYKNQWRWVTNNGWSTDVEFNMITKLPSKYKEVPTEYCKTVQDLIDYCIQKNDVDIHKFSPDYTYMFELISPRLRILVDNHETDLVYLGCRNNYSYNEYSLNIAKTLIPIISKFNTVKYFDLHNINEVIDLCNSYKGDEDEGVVVVDKDFNRVKIKCQDYIRLKVYRNMFDTTEEQIWKGMREGTIDDVLQVFPELNERIKAIKETAIRYKKLLESYGEIGKKEFNRILSETNNIKQTKRIYADWVKKTYPVLYFAVFEGVNDVPNYDRYLDHIKYKEMVEILKKEENL